MRTADTSLLLEALGSLREVGLRINRLAAGKPAELDSTLRLIAESAASIVPGSSAIIFACRDDRGTIDPVSRASSGRLAGCPTNDPPRASGFGMRAIRLQRPVLSYDEPDIPIHPAIAASGATSVACLPLMMAERVVGVLYVYVFEARRLSELQLLLLGNLVNQAAIAIYHSDQYKDVHRNLARKEDELTLLRHAGLLISSRTRLEDTLEAILQMALEITGARYGIFRLVDRDARNLVVRAIAGEGLGCPAVEALPINSTSVMGLVAKTRRPIIIADIGQPPWSRIYYPLDHALQMRSELAIPLIGAGGRLEGVLNLESPQLGAFGEEDSHLLQALAAQAVIAIQEVRLLDGLRETTGRLLVDEPGILLGHLVALACDLVNAETGAIWESRRSQASLLAATESYREAGLAASDKDLASRALTTASPLTYRRHSEASVSSHHPANYDLVMPILSAADGTPVGAFILHCRSEDLDPTPSEWDKKVLAILAHYVALALENAARRDALRAAQEARAVAETFAAMGDIAANLLHHLNNKVGTIPVRVEGIQDKCPQMLEASPYLAANLVEIERSALDAMSTVRERLAVLRPIEPRPVSAADCVADALRSSRIPFGIQVLVRGLDGLPDVMAGRESLELVLTNLLENAAEAMCGVGTVSMVGRVEGSWVELVVADDGPGIPPEIQQHIFEFSFSEQRQDGLRGARTARGKLGFGLWWVKTVMARLGGSIAVESDGQQGTAFRLRLPAASVHDVS